MDVLKELEYYCNLKNPVGALLLTGEWGCGKTYLIEHELKERLEKTHVILRISLFGIDSLEAVNMAAKKSWMEKKFGVLSKIAGAGKKIKDPALQVAELIPEGGKAISTVAGSVLSINVSDFIKVDNKIGGKKVVLVFDDLERSRLETTDILGIINEFCENQGFNVIVVANEEKLEAARAKDTDKEKDSEYRTMKEKVIQRTLFYEPDYKIIVDSILESYQKSLQGSIEYKGLLNQYKEGLQALFSGESITGEDLDTIGLETIRRRRVLDPRDPHFDELKDLISKGRLHNLRSFKCAIQDFFRLYELLREDKDSGRKAADHMEKWLYSFVCCMLAVKAFQFDINDEEDLYKASGDMEFIYPTFFDESFMPYPVARWISKGVWDEEGVKKYIEQKNSGFSELDFPGKSICFYDVYQMEDEDIVPEYTAALKLAYSGELVLFHYSTFISNLASLRLMEYQLPEQVDWKKLREGISKKLQAMLEPGAKEDETPMRSAETDYWTEDEKKAYEMLFDSNINTRVMYEQNKREFINMLADDPSDAFNFCLNNVLDDYNSDMAEAVVKAFDEASNYDKSTFYNEFYGAIYDILSSDAYKNNPDKNKGAGLDETKKLLDELKVKYQNMPVALSHTDLFQKAVVIAKNPD